MTSSSVYKLDVCYTLRTSQAFGKHPKRKKQQHLSQNYAGTQHTSQLSLTEKGTKRF